MECLECGRILRYLSSTHLGPHNLTPTTYREKYGLNKKTSLADPDVSLKLSVAMKRDRRWLKSSSYINQTIGSRGKNHGKYRKEFKDAIKKRLALNGVGVERMKHCVKVRNKNKSKWINNLSIARKKWHAEHQKESKEICRIMREKGKRAEYSPQYGKE